MARRDTGTTRPLIAFARATEGNATVWSLMMITTFLFLGGYAVDVSNLSTESIRLQAAVDTAAHAALVERELHTAEEAKLKAITLAEANLSPEVYGDVLDAADIVFGAWDETTQVFTPDPDLPNAVQATVYRTEANQNALDTYMWQVAGVNAFDLTARATYTTYVPTCFREGFVATDEVNIQSNNSYFSGFCIHSNSYVALNANNFFESGTVVSMPDLDLLQLPNSGFESNLGLESALREGSYNIRIINRITDIVETIDEAGSPYRPDYLTESAAQTLTDRTIDETNLIPGRLYYWNCTGGSGTIRTMTTAIRKVVIVTPCEVAFGANAELEDVVIVSSNTSLTSFSASSGLTLGKDDDCAVGGGVQLVTLGGMTLSANLAMFGSQLLALRDIEFAARADGFEGAAIVSGGSISGTSNMNMSFCGTGMEENFVAQYFRMVE
ncbi:MAG: pilus assembly protein TadG-related protein [Paracoccaceae bacterium]